MEECWEEGEEGRTKWGDDARGKGMGRAREWDDA